MEKQTRLRSNQKPKPKKKTEYNFDSLEDNYLYDTRDVEDFIAYDLQITNLIKGY